MPGLPSPEHPKTGALPTEDSLGLKNYRLPVVLQAHSYVQPATFDILAGGSPASVMDGWAE